MEMLYEDIEFLRSVGTIGNIENIVEFPTYISNNLNPKFAIRPYQEKAFENFIIYYERMFDRRKGPHTMQVLFHMATGSGKTLIMAGLMLYLYEKGYRNFLFFVNLTTTIEKTRDNFLNTASSKYLFAKEIAIDGRCVKINEVNDFQDSDPDAINICFTSTQALHHAVWEARENRMTLEDFKNQKVVLISDEAHHLNVDTLKHRKKEQESDYRSWQFTVENIYSQNPENILLEFTATCDMKNEAIKETYKNKIVFNYPLMNFYNDKYSKAIYTLRSCNDVMDRAIQALVLSQYRLMIFQRHGVNIKPVVLFKSKSIQESNDFSRKFISTIDNLKGNRLREIAIRAGDDTIVGFAFKYFQEIDETLDTLAEEIKDNFSEQHCISTNEEDDDIDAVEMQRTLNSLEDADNPYRAIFEVKKLDEGWDVLNLFDIVRIHESKDSGSTISEAQLIGRGARYCPFQFNPEQPMYQRKYDDDAGNELRVCETLYYHCINDSEYVNELHCALHSMGLDVKDAERVVSQKITLKEAFKTKDIYRNGLVFINDRVEVTRREGIQDIFSDVHEREYQYRDDFGAVVDSIMDEHLDSVEVDDRICFKRIRIKEIAEKNYAVVNKALMKYPVFMFSTLKSYFPNLISTREFVVGDNYLGNITINIQSRYENPPMRVLYSAVLSVLEKIADDIARTQKKYHGTKEFRPMGVSDVFHDKVVTYTNPHDGGVGVSQNDPSVNENYRINLKNEDWFAYTDNYGTTEEKIFVRYFRNHIERFKETYNEVYLVRNEREFRIYSFDDGESFEPDYVLFLRSGDETGYEQMQVFIEPKGTHLLKTDEWKEDFLLQLQKQAIPVKVYADDNEYKIWGLHFFNHEDRVQSLMFDNDINELLNR